MGLKRIAVCLIAVVLILVLTAACTGGAPTLTECVKDLAVSEILSYPDVLGAAVGQDGIILTLAVVVAFGSGASVAKDVGDNFVRTVKSHGPESAPSNEIGKGDFDYLVTVVYPDRTEIARGAKISSSPRIIW